MNLYAILKQNRTYSESNSASKQSRLLVLTSLGMALLCNTITFAQAESSNDSLGILVFETETIDYGTIQQNDNGLRSFKFSNSGSVPIVISKVKTSCGCTVPNYPKQAVLPGESAAIDIVYATNRLGKFSKSITVFSNANQSQKLLRIKGNVIASKSSQTE